MKISAIKQQIKNKDRLSIYVDESYAFSLSQNGLLSAGLAVGDELTEEQLQQLKQLSDEDKMYERTLNLLSIRPRSRWEIETYLKRKKVDVPLQQAIIGRLEKSNLIDDEAFARSWVESRRLLKPTSKRKLWQELKVKRISDDVISTVLAQDETDEASVLRELISRKRKQPKYQDQLKLMQYLSRQGFSYGDIKAALDDAENN